MRLTKRQRQLIRMRQIRRENPARWLELKREANRRQCADWAKANPEKVLARVKRWQRANPERLKKARRWYYAASKRASEDATGQLGLPL